MTWDSLQTEVADWALHNFGLQKASQPMLGLIEEVGEFYAAMAARSVPAQHDAMADQVIYVLNLAEICGMRFEDLMTFNMAAEHTAEELLGALALSCRAVLKHEQGIRGFDDDKRRDVLRVSLGVWMRWLRWQAGEGEGHTGLNLLNITEVVWRDVVAKRDWRKNPKSAASQEQVP